MKKRYKQEYSTCHEYSLVVCPNCGEDETVKNYQHLLKKQKTEMLS